MTDDNGSRYANWDFVCSLFSQYENESDPRGPGFMNQDQLLSFVRTTMGALSAIALTHGVGSASIWELVTGIVLAVVPLMWGYFVHSDNGKLAAVEALPGVQNIQVHTTAAGVVLAAAEDPNRPKINLVAGPSKEPTVPKKP